MINKKLKICLFVFRLSSFVKNLSAAPTSKRALEHWNIGTLELFLGYYKLLQSCNVAKLQHVFLIFAPYTYRLNILLD